MARPQDLHYLESHEWAKLENEEVTIGISDFAVEALNKEIVFIELPTVGQKVAQGKSFGVIESVKAASDLYAPVSGVVTASNDSAVDDPNIVSEHPFTDGWLIKIKPDVAELPANLLDPNQYEAHVEKEAH